jgi:hypothetical protein
MSTTLNDLNGTRVKIEQYDDPIDVIKIKELTGNDIVYARELYDRFDHPDEIYVGKMKEFTGSDKYYADNILANQLLDDFFKSCNFMMLGLRLEQYGIAYNRDNSRDTSNMLIMWYAFKDFVRHTTQHVHVPPIQYMHTYIKSHNLIITNVQNDNFVPDECRPTKRAKTVPFQSKFV